MTMRKFVTVVGFIGCLACAASVAASPAANGASEPDRPTTAAHQDRAGIPEFRDEAAMVLVGSALIGLAAAVRRAA
jgi:hypothetical protein